MSAKNKSSTQLAFFITSEDIASRSTIRQIATGRSDSLYVIPFDSIIIRPEFNWRRKPSGMTEEEWEIELGIPDLADGIFQSCGSHDPLVGDILKDEKFYINEGERRYRAIRHILKTKRTYPNGAEVNQVSVSLNPKEFTDIDRKIKIFTSQNKRNLKPMEIAYGYLGLKTENGKTHEQIAEMFSISRQKVDNYILATELDEDTQMGIDNGTVKLTNALSALRKERKDASAPSVLSNIAIDEFVPGGFAKPSTNPACDKWGEVISDVQEQEKEEIEVTEEEKSILYEKEQANLEEFESHKTNPNFTEKRPKSDRTDALSKVDMKRQLSEGEMDIEQAVKLHDKMEVMVSNFPGSFKQAKNDLMGLLNYSRKFLLEGLDKIKRSSSAGSEE